MPRPPTTPRTPSNQRNPGTVSSPPAVAFPQAYPSGASPPSEYGGSTYFPLAGFPFADAEDAESRYSALSALDSPSRRVDRGVPPNPTSFDNQTGGGSDVPGRRMSGLDAERAWEADEAYMADGARRSTGRSQGMMSDAFGSPLSGTGNAPRQDDEDQLGRPSYDSCASPHMLTIPDGRGGTAFAGDGPGSSFRPDIDAPRPPVTDGSIIPRKEPSEPIFVESSVGSKRLSSGYAVRCLH